jgi:hypothetical protein
MSRENFGESFLMFMLVFWFVIWTVKRAMNKVNPEIKDAAKTGVISVIKRFLR